MKRLHRTDVVAAVSKEHASWQAVLSTPNVKDKIEKHNDNGNGVIYVQCRDIDGKVSTFNKPHMEFSELKKQLRSENWRKHLVFLSFDSFRYWVMIPKTKPMPMLRYLVTDMGNKRFFLGEDVKSMGELEDAHIAKECLCVNAIVNGKMTEVLFPLGEMNAEQITKDLSEGNIVKICGMEVPEVVKRKVHGKTVLEKQVSIFVNEYTYEHETYPDVAAIIPKLTSYDDYSLFRDAGSDIPLYPEEVNTLLLFSVMYMRPAEPPFNIILSGVGGSAKTSCASFLSKVFSDDGSIISANMGTAKGLVPAYGDSPHPGLLIEPRNFVKVIDEFFRRSEKEALGRGKSDPTPYVYNFLTEAMNVVERRADVVAGSGKGQLPPGTVMRDSFLATDNLNPTVRYALSTAVIQDKAVMRRFTFLQLTDEEANGVRNATVNPSVDEVYPMMNELAKKKGYSLPAMKRYSRWFRRESLFVKFDRQMAKKMTEGIIFELVSNATGLSGDENEVVRRWVNELNVIPYMEAFIRCVALSNAVFASNEEKLPKDVQALMLDYAQAERLFRRLFTDTMHVYRDGLVEAAKKESQGVSRTMGGLMG